MRTLRVLSVMVVTISVLAQTQPPKAQALPKVSCPEPSATAACRTETVDSGRRPHGSQRARGRHEERLSPARICHCRRNGKLQLYAEPVESHASGEYP
jgi:hypothetical protein